MRSLIKKILKEEQEWFDDIKPMNVYLPWVEDGIKGLEEWGGQAYQSDDEIGEAIAELKLNPTKENVRYTSGSTLLCNLLNMNPKFHATATSPLLDCSCTRMISLLP